MYSNQPIETGRFCMLINTHFRSFSFVYRLSNYHLNLFLSGVENIKGIVSTQDTVAYTNNLRKHLYSYKRISMEVNNANMEDAVNWKLHKNSASMISNHNHSCNFSHQSRFKLIRAWFEKGINFKVYANRNFAEIEHLDVQLPGRL